MALFERLLGAATHTLNRRPAPGFLVLACFAGVHLVTLTISPPVWQDEVQIVDLGRSVLTPDPTWSMSWTAQQRPVAPINYLGPVVQEAAYRLLAPSVAGPRLSTLLGALLVACLAWRWLCARGVSAGPALVLASALLLDPVFVQGYRGARVDCWAIAIVLSACTLLRRGGDVPSSLRLALVGGLALAALFVWPTAIYLLPLLAAELIQSNPGVLTPSRLSLRAWLALAGGGLVALSLCLLPIAGLLPGMVGDILVSQSANTSASSPSDYLPKAVWNLVYSFQLSPFLPLAAALVAGMRGNRVLAGALIVAVAGMLPTHMYVHRAVYLLPYAVGLVSEVWRGPAMASQRTWRAPAMAVIVLWAATLSLGIRPAVALSEWHARSPSRIDEAAAQLPEIRSQRVYLESWEFYYAGRRRGWKMVCPYGDIGQPALAELLSSLDFALVGEVGPSGRDAFFEAMGWRLARRITLPSTQRALFGGAPRPRQYRLYSRARAASARNSS